VYTTRVCREAVSLYLLWFNSLEKTYLVPSCKSKSHFFFGNRFVVAICENFFNIRRLRFSIQHFPSVNPGPEYTPPILALDLRYPSVSNLRGENK
jgi:hypothetical protein